MRAPPRLLVATKNAGKLAELRALLAGLPALEVLGLGSPGLELADVEETGETYEENALLKARALLPLALAPGATAGFVLADDSGLEVDALGGAPGVRSARYAGGDGSEANNAKLLGALEGVADGERSARFRSVLVWLDATRPEAPLVVEGRTEGSIAREARGSGGFGYDPIFAVGPRELAELGRDPERTITMAELRDDEKNRISHRGRAMRELLARLEREGLGPR